MPLRRSRPSVALWCPFANQRGRAAHPSTSCRPFAAQHADGGRQHIRSRRVGGNHRHRRVSCQAHASARIENVRVAHAADLDPLLLVPGGRDAAAGDDDRAAGRGMIRNQPFQRDRPSLAARRRIADGEVSSRGDQRLP